jgi:hypothetical protein
VNQVYFPGRNHFFDEAEFRRRSVDFSHAMGLDSFIVSRISMNTRPMTRLLPAACLLLLASAGVGCFSVKTEHKIEPIHITMDVNLRLERELEETFSSLDQRSLALAKDQTTEGSEE